MLLGGFQEGLRPPGSPIRIRGRGCQAPTRAPMCLAPPGHWSREVSMAAPPAPPSWHPRALGLRPSPSDSGWGGGGLSFFGGCTRRRSLPSPLPRHPLHPGGEQHPPALAQLRGPQAVQPEARQPHGGRLGQPAQRPLPQAALPVAGSPALLHHRARQPPLLLRPLPGPGAVRPGRRRPVGVLRAGEAGPDRHLAARYRSGRCRTCWVGRAMLLRRPRQLCALQPFPSPASLSAGFTLSGGDLSMRSRYTSCSGLGEGGWGTLGSPARGLCSERSDLHKPPGRKRSKERKNQ